MPNSSRVAVILAGGSGERFWPLSRPDRPKQLLKLSSADETLLEEAVHRAEPLFGSEHVFVATGARIGPLICDTGVLDADQVLIEPSARNTLGAICWAVAQLMRRGYSDQTTMAILTADHAIGDRPLFRETLSSALDLAKSSGGLVTLGIAPTRPETGYGYIQVGEAVEGGFKVARFAEKPPPEEAERYVASGEYLWNSGMFFWRIGAFRSELALFQPEAASALDRLASSAEAFEQIPSLPIDRALMERSANIYVVPAHFPWDDVGAWDALARTQTPDGDGNVEVGQVEALDSSGCIAYSEGIPIGLIGVKDLVVVATTTGVLVCHKSQAQRVRELLAKLSRKP